MSDGDTSSFGKFVPGFEFMQSLARQATGGLTQGVPQSVPQLPNLGSWVAPTFNVEDIEKRIQELKTVHFWLDQNSRALSATIQALEVQKMTLSTLQGMNVSLGDVANAMKINTADMLSSMSSMGTKPVGAASTQTEPTQFAGLEVPPRRPPVSSPLDVSPSLAGHDEVGKSDVAAATAADAISGQPIAGGQTAAVVSGGVIDPMQWWGALSQQFQAIASTAMNEAANHAALDAAKNMATTLTDEALKTASSLTAGVTHNLAATGAAKSARGAASTSPKPAVKKAAKTAVKPASGTAAKASKASPKVGGVFDKPKARSAASAPAATRKPSGRTR